MREMQKRALTGTDVPASKPRTSSSTNKALVRWGWLSVFLLGSAQATECPLCAPSHEKQDGVDLRVANTAPIIEPDWELLLKARVAEADRLGLLRSEQRKTAETMKRHAQTPVDLKLPKARVGTKRRMVILDADAVRSMATPVKDVLSGFTRGYVFFNADDPVQRKFVMKLPSIGSGMRPVATAGNVSEASRAMNLRLYADQGGVLMRRFALKAVPTVVVLTFDGRELAAEIEEAALEDEAAVAQAP